MKTRNSFLRFTATGILLFFISSAIYGQSIPGTRDHSGQSFTQDFKGASGGLEQLFNSTGHYTLSADGAGMTGSYAYIQVSKPTGAATVQKAFLISSVTGVTIPNLSVNLCGVAVTWSGNESSSYPFHTYWTDVTAVVSAAMVGHPAGTYTLGIGESSYYTPIIEGEALLVVFNDAAAPEQTIIIMYGAQALTGGTLNLTLAEPIDPALPGAKLDMGVGIGYSYQYGGSPQYSVFRINNNLLTSSAGGEDDGASVNGALITVGGIGDVNTNPVNPSALPANPRSDDELYTLLPFINGTTTGITVANNNPTHDDNLFLEYFVLSQPAVAGEGILLTQSSSSGMPGTYHTLTAKAVNSLGQPWPGKMVTFNVLSGPEAGNTFSLLTDGNGESFYSYMGDAATGTDNVQACFVNDQNQTLCSNTLDFDWVCPNPVPVTNSSDNGPGSLRYAIGNVCDFFTAGSITFADNMNGQTINLTSGPLVINKNIILDNCNHSSGITISGSGDNIVINPGKMLTLSGCSKITVTGNIKNNAGTGGLVISSGASLIQNTIDLPATAQRKLTAGWHLFGSPFKQSTGATYGNLIPAGSTTQMIPYSNGTGWGAGVASLYYFLQPSAGYAVRPGMLFTASLSGNLFSSPNSPPCDYSVSLVYNGNGPNQSWNLLANPFTSFINWNLMGKTNVSTTLYLWDCNLYPGSPPVTTTSYFRTYNSASGIGVPAGTQPYIAPLQGFFVKASYNNPRLTFPLSARTNILSSYYKDNSGTEILLRLKLETESGTGELAICKNPAAKSGLDEFDSEEFFDGLPVEFCSQASSAEKLVINTVNNTGEAIPLVVSGKEGAGAKITAFALESKEKVYLEDRYMGKIISLAENTVYEFDFPSDVISGRFFVRFGEVNHPPAVSDVKVFESNRHLNIIAQTGEQLQKIEVYSLTGECVYASEQVNGNMFTGDLSLVPAIYLVRVKTSVTTQNVKLMWH